MNGGLHPALPSAHCSLLELHLDCFPTRAPKGVQRFFEAALT